MEHQQGWMRATVAGLAGLAIGAGAAPLCSMLCSIACAPGSAAGARKKYRIGIIGGSGPEAGMDLFGKVLRIHRARLGARYKTDRDAPDVLLVQASGIGGPRGPADVVPGSPHYESSWTALVEAITELAPRVDCFCVGCNQLHCFEPQIRRLLETLGEPADKFVSMVAATTAHCQKLRPASLAICGGPVTTDLAGSSPYRPLAAAMAEAVHPLPAAQCEALKALITRVKQEGDPSPVCHCCCSSSCRFD